MPVLDPAVRARYDAEWRPLIEWVAVGDLDGLARLYDLSSPVVYLLARLVLGDDEEAQEATLDTFEAIWRRAVEFDPSCHSACGWVARIASERAYVRRRRVRDSLSESASPDLAALRSALKAGELRAAFIHA